MKKFDPRTLPYLGAFVQAILFALAGYKYFALGYFGAAAGFGIGMLVNFSMAVASSKVGEVAKARRVVSYLSLVGLFILSPVIICSSLGWSLANLSWSLAADLSIMLTGATIGGSLVKKDETPKPVDATPKPARNPKKVAEKRLQKPVTDDELLSFFAGNPGATNTDAAQHFGVTRQAIGKRVKKLYEVKQ